MCSWWRILNKQIYKKYKNEKLARSKLRTLKSYAVYLYFYILICTTRDAAVVVVVVFFYWFFSLILLCLFSSLNWSKALTLYIYVISFYISFSLFIYKHSFCFFSVVYRLSYTHHHKNRWMRAERCSEFSDERQISLFIIFLFWLCFCFLFFFFVSRI